MVGAARVLLALLCLFVVATSASAESVWILWAQLISVAGDDNTPTIAVLAMGAWTTREECDQHRKENLWPPRPPGTEHETIGAVYVCLPDHVNLVPGH